MSLYENYTSTWIKLFENGERRKLTDDIVGFNKKNDEKYHMGGCYLYAYDPTHEIAGDIANHLDPKVVYIGTAGSSTFRGICSRTGDFTGTIMKGAQQKNPYDNATLFRILYGEENRDGLYVAYLPMGYGKHIKIPAHRLEKQLQDQYIQMYGSLPPCDGPIDTSDRIVELYKQLNSTQQKIILEKLEKSSF